MSKWVVIFRYDIVERLFFWGFVCWTVLTTVALFWSTFPFFFCYFWISVIVLPLFWFFFLFFFLLGNLHNSSSVDNYRGSFISWLLIDSISYASDLCLIFLINGHQPTLHFFLCLLKFQFFKLSLLKEKFFGRKRKMRKNLNLLHRINNL